MKSKCSFILKASLALVLTILMVLGSVSTVIAAVADVATGDDALPLAAKKGMDIAVTGANADLAGTGGSWIAFKRLYFGVPTSWSGSFTNLYAASRQTNGYCVILGKLTEKVSGSRIYGTETGQNIDHSSWGTEYLYIFASDSSYTVGSGYSNPTVKSSYATTTSTSSGYINCTNLNNTGNNYFIYPTSDATGCGIAYRWNNYGDMGYLGTDGSIAANQGETPYVNQKFVNSSGGSSSMTGYRITANSAASFSSHTNSTNNTNLGCLVGSKVTITATASSGYELDGFYSDSSYSTKITSGVSGSTYTYTVTSTTAKTTYVKFKSSATTYTGITAVAKGTTDGSSYSVGLGTIQSSTSVTSTTGLAVSAGSYSNYTFSKWVASGSGTFANANNASTTFYPAANSEVATAQYKRSYSVTKNSPSNGTITLSKTTVLAGDTFKVTLSPSSGYRVATFTVDNVDKKSSLNSSNEYTHTATGTGTSFAVSATFEAIPGTTIYIKKTMPTFTHIHLWNGANTTNISDAGAWPGDKFTTWSTTSDGKYYYKTYTWNCATFKFILNNNSDKQTNDSDAYATGTSYYIDSATAGQKAVLTEGTPSSKAITYTSTFATSDITWGGTKPASAYPGETVSFTAVAKSGYRLVSVKYNDGSDHTLTDSSGTYSFTMPSSAVTVTATTVKTYSVSLTTGTGVKTKQYKLGSSGTYGTYSSALTVDEGTDVYFKVTYDTGYEYASNTGLTVVTANTEFKTGAVSAAKAATINAQKITWSGLTAVGKYSTTAADNASYSNDFPAGTAPNVTIAATSATQLDGVAVTAPATDPTGYVFAGWYSSTGSFANAANKDTTFKPNAANAVAIAKYKKIFTITSSVDDTGTGAGTASTSVTSVVAGGSYTITATAASGSAIESVKVNGTAKTATASQTISSVSADQTVVVKFASKAHLIGGLATNAWNEPGDAMKSNADGTKFTITISEKAAGTYEFKHYVGTGSGGTYNATAIPAASQTLNGIATLDNSGTNGNYKLVTTVKSNIILESNGTNFTSITVTPANVPTYNVTLKKVAGSTITSTYMGKDYSTADADAVVPVYQGTEISFTVTADSGKYLSGLTTTAGTLSPAFAVGDSYTGKISNVTSARTVTPTVANKFSVTGKTNKSSRGTVSVSPASARPGETVTITVSPKAGTLSTLTYGYAGGNTYTRNFTANRWDLVTAPSGAAVPASVGKNIALAAVGAESEITGVGADSTYTFTLDDNPTGAVTVNATFAAYSAESDWYYNGYDTSGNLLNDYKQQRMTEISLEGNKFSYYEVTGRTGQYQLYTVYNGNVTGGKFYVETPDMNDWTSHGDPKVYWFDEEWGTFHTLHYDHNISGNKKLWYLNANEIHENTGCLVVNGDNSKQTEDMSASDVQYGAVWIDNYNNNSGKYTWHRYSSGDLPSDAGTHITEFYYNAENRFWGEVAGFADMAQNEYGAGDHNSDNNKYARPSQDMSASDAPSTYYVMVFYPGILYTNGNNTLDLTGRTEPVVLLATELPVLSDEQVKVYAKDGAIRSESYGSTYANIADTQIVESASSTTSIGESHNGNISGQTYETYKAEKGETIYIRTTINTTAGNGADTTTNRNKYYVRGFCINGEVFELKTWDSSGVYTTSYKIPEDYESKYVEITPIYYLKDTTAHPIVTYRATGFTDELKQIGSGKPGWGDTLYTYPYYGKLGSNNNALGAYPGQPMVYYKGQYQMQIPEQSTAWDVYLSDSALSGTDAQKKTAIAATNVSGVTMSNGYYDSVHRLIMGYGNNGSSSDHVQTYDYGDFFKIFNEKDPVDNIVFDFKYETTTHNFETAAPGSPTPSNLTSTYQNGFELLTNFHGRTVDLFGTPLSGDAADTSKTKPLYVVSIGGVNGSAGVENIAGYYATEWKVFAPTTLSGTPSSSDAYSLVSNGTKNSIPPEVLVLNNDTTSFNNSTYPSAVSGKNLTDWKELYTALEAYRGKPVMISYEAADAQIGSGNYATSGGGGATRNDGRWLYSKNGETITSTIRVDVSTDNGATYTPNPASGESGHVDNLDAYFTNAEAEGETTYTTTIDPDKTFDIEAQSHNENYKFMGWYMDDGTKITTDNATHTERSGSYTFVARFMYFTGGQLILSHKEKKGTASNSTDYQGDGTTTIAVTVKNALNETVREFAASASDITLDDKIINNENADYTIEVTLAAAGVGEDTYARTECDKANTFFGNQSAYTTMPQTFSFTVGSLFTGSPATQQTKKITYNSYFNKVQYSYKYTFNFPARDGSTKSYVREGTLTAAQRESYVTGTGSEARVLTEGFVNNLAPHESNFNQSLKWSITAADRTFTKDGDNYTLTKTLTAAVDTESVGARSTKRTATFSLPYAHTNGVPSDLMIMDAATATNYVINNIEYGSLVKNTGEDGYVVAPRQLRETVSGETVTKNFQYWSVKTTAHSGEDDPDVARCYFYSFNFVAYDNYVITPVYNEAATPFGDSSNTAVTSISYLETSRNQFNGTGTTTSDRGTAADILYNDFVLSYGYNDVDIYKGDSSSSAITEIGYVIERVQKLEVQQDGTPYTDPSHYSNVTVKTESEIETFISSGSASSGTLSKKTVNKTSLDNKNRIEFYQAYYNSGGWDQATQKPGTSYGYKNYVYKAYTYMIVDGTVTLSAPAYFTMYDEATM